MDVGDTDNADDMWTFIIPRTSRLVAIVAYNGVGSRHVTASFSNGFKTSSKWKCSTQEEDDWTSLTFDDSHWQYAEVLGTETSGRLAGADRIWQGPVEGYVYCRGWIGGT